MGLSWLCTNGVIPVGHEVLMVLFLGAQNRLIAEEELFGGTLTQISVP